MLMLCHFLIWSPTYYLLNNCILILQKYEEQIDTLQRKVMEQSMTMSMYSSITPDEFRGGADEDVFGECIYIIKTRCVSVIRVVSEAMN